MSGPLNRLLEHVLEGEPELADEVDAIFHRAGQLRRRRSHAVLGAGAATAAVIVALGYVLTASLLAPRPATVTAPTVTAPTVTAPLVAPLARADVVAAPPQPMPSRAPAPTPAVADAVLELLEPLVEERELRVVPGSPQRGDGWRQYAIADAEGRSRGTVEVGVFDVRKKWCFPVAADRRACARPDRAGGLEFVRYDNMSDPDRQVRQTIARRLDDGRVLAVMAAGERDSGARLGKPGLTGAQAEQVATDDRILDSFGRDEDCRDGCPLFGTPINP